MLIDIDIRQLKEFLFYILIYILVSLLYLLRKKKLKKYFSIRKNKMLKENIFFSFFSFFFLFFLRCKICYLLKKICVWILSVMMLCLKCLKTRKQRVRHNLIIFTIICLMFMLSYFLQLHKYLIIIICLYYLCNING